MLRSETTGGSRSALLLALLTVYIVWGSTYLAIRFAIETLPTFTMAGARFLLAGGALYLWARAKGAPRPARRFWGPAAGIGALLLLGGNGLVVWAEHLIPSGVTALLVAVEPVWIALLAPLVLGLRRAGARTVVSLLAGMAGVAVLVIDPAGFDPSSVNPVGALAVVLASLSWALGSLWTVRAAMPESRPMATAMQMLCGGTLLLLVGGAGGEWSSVSTAAFSARSLIAFAYLVVFGSIIAFSAYTYLLRVARPSTVATYAFVNPVVAVLLGWAVAGEPLTARVGVAAVLILAAVAAQLSDGDAGAAPASQTVRESSTPAPPVARPLEDAERCATG